MANLPRPNRHLAARRAFRGVSQQALSYQVDLSRDRIWRIENGIAEPTPEERRAIADALGTTVADVFPSAAEATP